MWTKERNSTRPNTATDRSTISNGKLPSWDFKLSTPLQLKNVGRSFWGERKSGEDGAREFATGKVLLIFTLAQNRFVSRYAGGDLFEGTRHSEQLTPPLKCPNLQGLEVLDEK